MDDQNEACKAAMPGMPQGHTGSRGSGGSGPVPDHVLQDLALRKSLRALLEDYRRRWTGESAVIDDFLAFSWSDEALQGKANPKRHITASAWILDSSGQRALLTHHAKLDIWVQLGGHTDPGEEWSPAGLREAREESGLADLYFLDPESGRLMESRETGPYGDPGTDSESGSGPGDRAGLPAFGDRAAGPESGLPGTDTRSIPRLFDLDIHPIPDRPGTAAHLHYDLRFLLLAGNPDALVMSDESHDLAWVDLDRLEDKTREESQLRMRKKSPPGPLPRQ